MRGQENNLFLIFKCNVHCALLQVSPNSCMDLTKIQGDKPKPKHEAQLEIKCSQYFKNVVCYNQYNINLLTQGKAR